MYATCPKCGYRRQPEDREPYQQCPACGLHYHKWLKQRFRVRRPSPAPSPAQPGSWRRLRRLALEPAPAKSRAAWLGRLALLAVLGFWTWDFARMDHRLLVGGMPEINGSFWHLVNLAFHEAGHLLFRPFGDFMSVLGGSLMQLLVPLTVLMNFLLSRHDPFAAAAGLWWLGQSLMDLAPYIHDAQAQRMLLLGGITGRDVPGYHDWHNLLGRLGSLEAAPGLAELADGSGLALMLTALTWGGYLLYRQRGRL
jgi:hypothetical protein